MNRILGLLLAVLLLTGCKSEPAEKTMASAAIAPPSPVLAATPAPPVVAPTRPSVTPARMLYEQSAFIIQHTDTSFQTDNQRYYLALQARLDTLQPLSYQTKRDTTRGYQGYYTFTIRDSLQRIIGQRTLRKQDFYQAVGGDLAVLSYANLPTLVGYSAPLGGLVFSVNFGAPETDWLVDAALLLTLDGKVRHLVTDFVVGGPDVHAALAPDGCTLLTGGTIFRSNGAALPLERSGMELRGASLLGDSLAVVVYELGTWQPHPGESPDWVMTSAQKHRPNAFVVNTHSGHTISSFRYDGFWEELGINVPQEYLPATQTGYFLDDKKGLYLVSALLPQYVAFRSLKSLTRFEPPARPNEKVISLAGYNHNYQLHIDTLNPASIRYKLLNM